MNWNNPGSILNSQSVLSITTKMIDYHSKNCSEYIYVYNYSLIKNWQLYTICIIIVSIGVGENTGNQSHLIQKILNCWTNPWQSD